MSRPWHPLQDRSALSLDSRSSGATLESRPRLARNGKDAQSVDYGRLTALLIEATKEQQALIHKQQEQRKAQQKQMMAQQTLLIRPYLVLVVVTWFECQFDVADAPLAR